MRRDILFILLIVSLGANAWLISYQFGRMLPQAEPSFMHEHVPSERLEGMAVLLPESARPALRDAMKGRLPEIRERLQAIRDQRAIINRQLLSETPDSAALANAYARMRALHTESQAIYQDVFVQTLLTLPLDQRRQTVEEMNKMHPLDNNRLSKTDH